MVLAAADSAGRVARDRVVELLKRDVRFNAHWQVDLTRVDLPAAPSARRVVEALVLAHGASVGKPQPEVWIDHSPDNLSYAASLAAAIPDSRLIHIVRDGRGVAASLLRVDWGPNEIERAAVGWLRQLACGLAAENHENPAIRTHYEEVVRNPESELARLCSELEIEYVAEMVSGMGFRPSAYAASTHALVGAPPNEERISSWRRELTPRQVEIFESIVRDLLTYLGYQLEYGIRARRSSKIERRTAGARDLYARRVRNVIRRHRRLR
jgi:hypothetical protein